MPRTLEGWTYAIPIFDHMRQLNGFLPILTTFGIPVYFVRLFLPREAWFWDSWPPSILKIFEISIQTSVIDLEVVQASTRGEMWLWWLSSDAQPRVCGAFPRRLQIEPLTAASFGCQSPGQGASQAL